MNTLTEALQGLFNVLDETIIEERVVLIASHQMSDQAGATDSAARILALTELQSELVKWANANYHLLRGGETPHGR